MKHLIPVSTALLLLSASASYAQDESDALRYSLLQPQGTARSIGFGSALGSVGGDFSALSVNPAGIGIYRKSEYMVTPSIMFNSTDSRYSVGGNTSDDGTRFALSNVGVVWTNAARGKRYQNSNWKAVSFGIGINRMADFTRNYRYSGQNNQNSGSWVFEEDANSDFSRINAPTTPAYLGYESYLLAEDTAGGFRYVSVVDPTSGTIGQNRRVKERGGISEMALSIGGNYQEKLMLGATVGIPILRYHRESTYSEEDLSGNTDNDFSSYTYREDLLTNGAGVNLKLGFIYKPSDYFRFGGAFHTPTFMGLTDIFNADIVANTENFEQAPQAVNSAALDENQYDYTLITPWRGVLSATAMLGKYGFFTMDYEYVNYSSARYNFAAVDADYEDFTNDAIRNTYKGASNIRAGVEIKLDNFMLRTGLGYYGNPYKDFDDGSRLDISGGLGFRLENVFIDVAYLHRSYKNAEQPYNLSYTNVGAMPVANISTAQNNAVLTVGWKF